MSGRKSEPPALLLAMKERDYKKAVDLLNNQGLKKDDSWIDYICLIHAVIARQVDIVNLLLKKGCRVKGKPKTKHLCTPLYYAVQAMKNNKHKVLEIMETLLKAGASVTDKDKNEETPLQLAMKDKRKEAVELMLSNYNVKNIDIHSRDEKIHFVIACINNSYTLVEEFTKKGMKLVGTIDCTIFPNHEWPKNFTLLHIAVKFEAGCILGKLLKTGAYDFTLQDANQQSPLHVAYYSDEEEKKKTHGWCRGTFGEMVNSILSVHAKNLNNPVDKEGLSHFHIACIKGDAALVKNFLRHGVDMKKLGQAKTDTFLNLAVQKKNKELVNILIKYGADVNGKGSDGMTPLSLAMKLESYDMAETLLGLKANICIQDDKGNSPIHYAFFSLPKTEKLLERMLLIHQGTMSNLSNEDGLSVFHIACARSSVDIVKNFIKNKVDVNAALKKRSSKEFLDVNFSTGERSSKLPGSTALHFAAWTRNVDVIRVLLKHKADVNTANKDGVTPVMIAIEQPPKKKEVFEFVKSKLEACDDGSGADSDSSSSSYLNEKDSLLVDSIYPEFKHLEIIKLFIQKNCDLDHVDKKGKPLLFRAFSKLLDQYPSPFSDYSSVMNNRDTSDKSMGERIANLCIIFFVENFEKTINLLVQHGVNLNARDREGNSIFHQLVEHIRRGKVANTLMKIIEMFLIKGANAEIENNKGTLPINQAINDKSRELLKLFLKYKVNLNLADESNGTPLHNAALYSCNDRDKSTTHSDMIKLFLANGADINARDNDGQTPIFRACKWENPGKVMKFLLDEGADVNATDKDGRTALFAAAINNNNKCVQLLLEYGADIGVKDKYHMSVFKKLFTYQTHNNIKESKFDGVVTTLSTHARKLQMLGHSLSRRDLLYCKRLKYAYGSGSHPNDVKDLFNEEKRVDLDVFDEDDKLAEELKKELKKMKATSIDKHTSVYEILFKDLEQMKNHVENEKLKKYLDDKAFPLFGYLLRLKFREASTRCALLESAKKSYKRLTKKKLPDSCLHGIFDYLTNEDLKNLANARR